MIKNLEPVGNYMLVLFIGIAIGTIFPDFQRDKRKGAHKLPFIILGAIIGEFWALYSLCDTNTC